MPAAATISVQASFFGAGGASFSLWLASAEDIVRYYLLERIFHIVLPISTAGIGDRTSLEGEICKPWSETADTCYERDGKARPAV